MINANALLIQPNFKILVLSVIFKTVSFVRKTMSVLNVKKVTQFRVINVVAPLIPPNIKITVMLAVQLKFHIVFYALKTTIV